MTTYAWDYTVGFADWSVANDWVLLPATSPPTNGVVPAAGDAAYLAGNVTVQITSAQAVTTLGLGTTPLLGPTLPTLAITGSSLLVTGNVDDTSSGVFPDPADPQSVAGGGAINLLDSGTLEVTGTVAPGINVDFFDNEDNFLQLDGIATLAPAGTNAFQGQILGFVPGDFINIPNVPIDSVVFNDTTPGGFTTGDNGVLDVISNGATVAILNFIGAYDTGDFSVTGSTIADTGVTLPPLGSITWIGPTGADWNTVGDWSVDTNPSDPATGLPVSTDNVSIGNLDTVALAPQKPNEDPETDSVNSLQIAAGATLSIDTGALIIIDNDSISENQGEIDIGAGEGDALVQVSLSGDLENDGLVTLNLPGDSDLLTNGPTVTISGTGTIEMSGGDIAGGAVPTDPPYDELDNTGNTIEGNGEIGGGIDNALGHLEPITFINGGTVDANEDPFSLTLYDWVVNQGTLESSNGGTLTLSAAVDNTAPLAEIDAGTGSTVQLAFGTITGGLLQAFGTGKIVVTDDSTLDGSTGGMTIAGDVVVESGDTLNLNGRISGGTIDATIGTADISNATLTGVTLVGGHFIFGAGNALDTSGAPTDLGPWSVSGAGDSLTLDNTNGGGFVNSSKFALDGAGASLVLDGDVDVSGGGQITMNYPAAVPPVPDVITGGPGYDVLINEDNTISGIGVIEGIEIDNYRAGTIIAKGGTLVLNTGSQNIFNFGWIGAAADGDLVVMGTLDLANDALLHPFGAGTLGGTGLITLGGTVGATILPGTIEFGVLPFGGTVAVAAAMVPAVSLALGSDLDAVTNNGRVVVGADALLTIAGFANAPGDEFVNTGTIELQGTSEVKGKAAPVYHGATLAPSGDATLNGSGTIRLDNGGDPNGTADDTILSMTNLDTLENDGNTIAGAGLLGGSYLNLNNFATIQADVPGDALTMNAGSFEVVPGDATTIVNGTIANDGLMLATNGGTLAVASLLFNSGQEYNDDFQSVSNYGGGDVGAFGTTSAVDLDNFSQVAAGRLWSLGGGAIDVTGNATLSGGDVEVPSQGMTTFGAASVVVNTSSDQKSEVAVGGLTNGDVVVAWDDYAQNATTPVVMYQVLDQFGVSLVGGDRSLGDLSVGESQRHAAIAGLPGGGFVMTWLETGTNSTVTVGGALFNADLTQDGTGFTIQASVANGAETQSVTALMDGGFAVVWADSTTTVSDGADPMHVQLFSANGAPGAVINLPVNGLSPTIALASDRSGAFAVAWAEPGPAGAAPNTPAADGTVWVQFYTAAGVASGGPVLVGNTNANVQLDGSPPYIATGSADGGDGSFVVFWNDPAIPALQGQIYASNGSISPVDENNTASQLIYSGLFTAASAVLPDGRVAIVQDQSRTGAPSLGFPDVGLMFAASAPQSAALQSYANVFVDKGQSLSLEQGLYNDGAITLASGGADLGISGTVTLGGTGTITLDGATDIIGGEAADPDLINQGNTIQGQGTIAGIISGDGLSFNNFGGVVDATGGSLTIGNLVGSLLNFGTMEATAASAALNIAGDIVNDGLIKANVGVVMISDVVRGGTPQDPDNHTGELEISGGTMVLEGEVAASQSVFFTPGVFGLLELHHPAEMDGTIVNFNLGDTIDVDGISATSYNYDPNDGDPGSDVLNLVANGATLVSLNLANVSTFGTITLAQDGNGGTLIDLVPSTRVGLGAYPSVAALPGGAYVVAYEPLVDGTPVGGIYAQLYNGKGLLTGFLTVDGTGQQPSVAAQNSGQFLITWIDGTTNSIDGRIYDPDGDPAELVDANGEPINQPFVIETFAAGVSVLNSSVVAIQSQTPLGYVVSVATEDGGGVQSVSSVDLNLSGVATSAPDVISGTQLNGIDITDPQQLRAVAAGFQTQAGGTGGFTALAMVGLGSDLEKLILLGIVGDTLGGSQVIQSSADGARVTTVTNDAAPRYVMLAPPSGDVTYTSPEIAALTNGDLVVVWDQIGTADSAWSVVGQIVTSGGVFVGSGFAIETALPAASTPGRPAIDVLPNGDFVVTYNEDVTSLSGQKFDNSGNRVGDPFGVSNTSQGNVATTTLSDGTLLSVTSNGDGEVSTGTFTETPPGATWSGATGTDLGTAGNWQPVAIPDATDTLTFNAASGGTLSGTVTGMNAVFSGAGTWLLEGANVSLSGETLSPTSTLALSENGALIVTGGSIAAAGSLDIETGLSTAMSVLGGAHVTAEGVTLGTGGGQSGVLTVSGPGTAIQNTGGSGTTEIGGSGFGQVNIVNGASVADAAGGILGVSTGGEGTLTLSGTGSQFSVTGELDVGIAGSGSLTIENQASVASGDNAGSPSEGFDIAELIGGSGAVSVTGGKSLLVNQGRFIVGDAGAGSLAIAAGATVNTSPGGVAGLAGLVIANNSAASGSSVNVTGAGSNLTVAGTLVVGSSGYGSLSLSQGASVTAGALDLAAGATGDGDVSLAGVGTTLDVTGSLTLGDQAAGELSILGGAQMSIAGGLVGGTSGAGGNLDIEGSGSQLTINGGTLVVGADGPAEFTLGIGATLSGEVVTDLFGVTNEYGDVDPATDVVVGTQNVGFGSSSSADFYVANSGTIKITSGTATFYSPLATFDTGAQGGSVNGLWVIGAKDTLVMNTTSVDQSQTFDFTGVSAATLVIGQVPQGNPNDPDTFNGQTMPTMTGSVAAGASNVLSGWDAPISNYASGDVITLRGLTYGSATASGDVVTVWSGPAGGGNALGSLTFVDNSDQPSSTDAALAATQINALACFAAGTRIGTVGGWAKVEDLAVGDRVRTVDGRCEPVVWIGSRHVDCARHPKPETVWPVRISAGAFGENVPERDLYLSPDHAVYVDGVLVPVKLLVNGTSITQVKRNHVTYYHVELPDHAVILAEGLTVESYLETGHRANFDDQATIRLFPDFGARPSSDTALLWETRGVAPLVMTGAELAAARRMVKDSAPRRRSA